MAKFKVGDRVRVIDGDYDLALGSIQTIAYVDPTDGMVDLVDDLDIGEGYRSYERFELCEKDNEEVTPEVTPSALTSHPSGALRESKEGKGRPDLVLAGFPRALMALCRHVDCELGRERNWEKGLPESSLIASQFRHLLGYASGVSDDTPEYNLTANAWNAIVALEEYLRVQDGAMAGTVLDISKPEGV